MRVKSYRILAGWRKKGVFHVAGLVRSLYIYQTKSIFMAKHILYILVFLSPFFSYAGPDGTKLAINKHYDFTLDHITRLGYDYEIADLIAHYSSVYADHPPKFVIAIQGFKNRYRDSIDYSKTENSQDTKSIESSTWHSMKADGEDISDSAARMRGLNFAYAKLLSAAAEFKKIGGLGNARANTIAIQDLGQAIHAFQDATVHKGVDMKHHSFWDDLFPSQEIKAEVKIATTNAIILLEIINGNYAHVSSLKGFSLEEIEPDLQVVIAKALALAGVPTAVALR